ncbi:hypothetical protein DAT35_21830 [Vitiosangium sp. GDMCC 1.1324]|nr:hypothetical protein DAT35_21830 [Vitiosangium sp. GDMCC 1.1324]
MWRRVASEVRGYSASQCLGSAASSPASLLPGAPRSPPPLPLGGAIGLDDGAQVMLHADGITLVARLADSTQATCSDGLIHHQL